jgi:protein-tyrosine phosphatase
MSKTIAHSFGGKIGLLKHCLYTAEYYLGLFADLEQIDWGAVKRLVFVCRGNICRSPYGEVKSINLGIPAISFGLEAKQALPANKLAISVALSRGLDLSQHRTRSADDVPLNSGDLILAMEPHQLKMIRYRSLVSPAKISLLGLWCTPRHPHIQDPYGLAPEYFSTCFDVIDDALNRIASLFVRSARG